MTDTPRSIVIVGGGTSGWLTAAYLERALGRMEQPVSITVIASEEIGVIGVGEATIPTLRTTLQALEIPEWEFLAETDATFKNGILFRNWRNGDDEYFHLFDAAPPFEGTGAMNHWLRLRAEDPTIAPYAEVASLQAELCRQNRSPKQFSSGDFTAPISYAYHIDAVKFGRFLKRLATKRGVNYIEDTITSVALGDDGAISGVRTKASGDIAGDFFIDCSGFGALLIEKALGEPFESYGDVLFCDKAVALPIPYPGANEPRAYTTATAQSAGWTWEIDLMTRRGTGYVYSSRFLTPEAAEAELRAYVGEAAQGVKARHLDMRIGRRRNIWAKNCLSIGLAAGFIEPLESTGIYLVEIGIQLFLDHFDLTGKKPHNAAAYNRSMNTLFEHIRDFIVLHYCLTERDDTPFWRAVADDAYLPPRVQRWLDLWAEKTPTATDIDANQLLFLAAHNYFSVLAGMGYLPENPGAASLASLDSARRFVEHVDTARGHAIEASPGHSLYLNKLRGAAIQRVA